jgi:CDP-6-deoxy-D-xylo-4-hexulose-3-dehydrase
MQIIKHFFLKNKENINKIFFINNAKNVKASWCGISILINKNLKKFKNKIIRQIEKSGLETRPIVCGNILNQPAIKLFKLNKKEIYLKNCQEIEERGFYIGLNTKKSSLEKLKKISEILNNSLNKF